MCLGSSSKTKLKEPKTVENPVTFTPPQQVAKVQQPLVDVSETPDIRIGSSKKDRNRTTGDTSAATSSLTIGDNQGLNV